MSDPATKSSSNKKEPQLPKGWIKTFSKSQQRYYYSHKDTQHTQWHFPTASEAQDPWMAKRRAEENHHKEKNKIKKRSQSESNHSTSGAAVAVAPPDPKRPRNFNNVAAAPPKPTLPSTPSSLQEDPILALADTTNVAIIVPYRDLHAAQQRSKHLQQFVPHMIAFLNNLVARRKLSGFHIYIVEQSNDQRKFNRGKLLNIGFDLAKKRNPGNQKHKHDVFMFHDVDLLPQDALLDSYAHFPKAPYHIARVWDRYSNNPKYFGGIVSFSSSDFQRINGYPNTFWGWGGEDDELQLRCQNIGLKWDYPRLPAATNNKNVIQDLEDMTLHDKLQFLRQHKEWKCMAKTECLDEHSQTWKQNGLSDLQYKVLETKPLDPNGKATKITVDVKLNGNHWSNEKSGVDYMADWAKPR